LGDRVLDSTERERLIEQHLPLVRGLARRRRCAGESYEDLVQVGAVALVAAARRFDPGRGVPFAAYASRTIDGELRRHLRDRTSTVRLPRREQALAATLHRAAAVTAQRLGREASVAETAAAAGIDRDEAAHVLAATSVALLVSTDVAAPDELDALERRASLEAALAALDPVERRAVGLRFGADLPQHEIARRLRISQSQASRLLGRALDKLRHELASFPDSLESP
jgi:RNA polymerase sigma-B factor